MKLYGWTTGLFWGLGLFFVGMTFVAFNAQFFLAAQGWILLLLIPGFTFLSAGFFAVKDGQRVFDGLFQTIKTFMVGEFSHRTPQEPAPRELSDLAKAFNQLGEGLGQRFRNLVEQRNELEAVLESMMEAVIVLDAQFHIKRVNPAARQLFGLINNSWKDKSLLEVCHSFELAQKSEEAMALGSLKSEFQILQGAKTLTIGFEASGIKDSFGDLQGLVLVINDITTIKNLEQIRRDFVANVSHELKTPITNILGYVETLQSVGLADQEKSQGFLNVIERHAERMNRIIEDLLTLSRIEQGKPLGMDKVECQLADVLAAGINVCQPKMDQKSIELLTHIEEAPSILCYPPLMEQAVVNLLDNAVKYSPPSRPIEIHTGLKDQEVFLAIQDHGVGIPHKDLQRIFERFYRVEKTGRDASGTGLGLSIVRHIMALHEGRIEVKSLETVGTTFTLYFPLPNPPQS